MRTLIGAAMLVAGACALASTASAQSPAGYKRCAACHLETGEGVPGAFPPLTNRLGPLAATQAGRDYLVLVIEVGLMGAIKVDGTTYRGMMPPQKAGLDDSAKAEVLNHIISAFNADTAPDGWREFAPDELADVRARHGSVRARDVHLLRPAAFNAVLAGENAE